MDINNWHVGYYAMKESLQKSRFHPSKITKTNISDEENWHHNRHNQAVDVCKKKSSVT